jgi:hypothetical protein
MMPNDRGERMNMFAKQYRYTGFVWLGKCGQAWVERNSIPAFLLDVHDAALVALDVEPNDRKAATDWLDACDAIAKLNFPVLDRTAVKLALETQLRQEADERKLNAMLCPTSPLRP